MGSMALTWTPPDMAAEQVRYVRERTSNPFLVNFAMAFPPESLDAALEAGAPIVTFSLGDPTPYVGTVKGAGVMMGIQVTNAEGARRAIELGADFLVCQGVEAGGHVQSTTPLLTVLPRVVEAATGVPVVAAGGIADGRGIATVLDLGAAGAVLGTRFLATKESRAHEHYKKILVETEGETALTICFDGGWPQSPHRVLRNSTLEAWEAAGGPSEGSRPGEGDEIAQTAGGEGIYRYEMTAPKAGYVGDIEAMCVYSGTGSRLIKDVPGAAELVERLWRECQAALDSPM